MKAMVYTNYGPPEVLRLAEFEKPSPREGEVLIKISATTVNRTDCGFRRPEYPLIIRLINGPLRPRIRVLGSELAGVVEETGKNVTQFTKGDRVFGLSVKKFGAHAEYICLPETAPIAAMPANMSFDEAAAVCDGMMLAMNYIGKIDFMPGMKILINGASGSIGSAGVQLARNFGAEITAVCDTRNVDLARSLGANKVIDYTREDFTRDSDTYDVVFDAVGKSSFFKCRKLLKPRGVYCSTELGFLMQNVFLSLVSAIPFGRKVIFPIPRVTKEDIVYFKDLIEAGKFRAVIDRRYPLERMVEAARYVETGLKAGSIVITM